MVIWASKATLQIPSRQLLYAVPLENLLPVELYDPTLQLWQFCVASTWQQRVIHAVEYFLFSTMSIPVILVDRSNMLYFLMALLIDSPWFPPFWAMSPSMPPSPLPTQQNAVTYPQETYRVHPWPYSTAGEIRSTGAAVGRWPLPWIWLEEDPNTAYWSWKGG